MQKNLTHSPIIINNNNKKLYNPLKDDSAVAAQRTAKNATSNSSSYLLLLLQHLRWYWYNIAGRESGRDSKKRGCLNSPKTRLKVESLPKCFNKAPLFLLAHQTITKPQFNNWTGFVIAAFIAATGAVVALLLRLRFRVWEEKICNIWCIFSCLHSFQFGWVHYLPSAHIREKETT